MFVILVLCLNLSYSHIVMENLILGIVNHVLFVINIVVKSKNYLKVLAERHIALLNAVNCILISLTTCLVILLLVSKSTTNFIGFDKVGYFLLDFLFLTLTIIMMIIHN